jgi:uncharacterized protein YkwD
MIALTFFLLLLQVQSGKPEIRIADLERQIHQLTNVHRVTNDLERLEWDDQLAKIARAHSEDMVARKYFKHINPEGLSPMKRAEAAGYKCQMMGENLYQGNLYSQVITEKKHTTYDWNSMEKIAAASVKGWMDSEGHRRNILEKDYKKEGIGVAVAENDEGKVYVTQMLCGAAPEETQDQEK